MLRNGLWKKITWTFPIYPHGVVNMNYDLKSY